MTRRRSLKQLSLEKARTHYETTLRRYCQGTATTAEYTAAAHQLLVAKRAFHKKHTWSPNP